MFSNSDNDFADVYYNRIMFRIATSTNAIGHVLDNDMGHVFKFG